MIRIFHVDDHATVRQGVRTFLEAEGDMTVAGESGRGGDALRAILAGVFDLVLLDISLPDRDGLEVLKRLKLENPRLPVLVFTMHDEEVLALRCMKAGADGYLTKDSDPGELITAIRTLHGGRKHVSALLAERILRDWNRDPLIPRHEGLSNREFTVLRLLASGETVSTIAEKLALNVRTVSTYRRRLLDKMGLKNNSELIGYAVKHQLIP
ncbi:MAG: response regulator transcription factor [Magnetococcales bacterium]|nr:response regulator transcription factor [Magnetococcales bacterium]